jgi:hypothetical protein
LAEDFEICEAIGSNAANVDKRDYIVSISEIFEILTEKCRCQKERRVDCVYLDDASCCDPL